ncbi:hypothetical protein L2E82_22630 [Cichorium intybus]|uniref:Uncharacterized protein n=1 Tax=Cichorium intybus TaxID=13427 RepID=A0ACB9DZ93_CICIN|nr:hypothetical protein L2E82_22630 [Cichorium intybus]
MFRQPPSVSIQHHHSPSLPVIRIENKGCYNHQTTKTTSTVPPSLLKDDIVFDLNTEKLLKIFMKERRERVCFFTFALSPTSCQNKPFLVLFSDLLSRFITGETSIASTISYLYIAFVYVGSSYGDSQLVKLNLQPDTKGEVLERYDMQSEKGSTGDNKVIISEKKELEEKLAAMSKEASSGITERGAQLTMVSEKQKPVMSLLELRSSIVQSLKWSRL